MNNNSYDPGGRLPSAPGCAIDNRVSKKSQSGHNRGVRVVVSVALVLALAFVACAAAAAPRLRVVSTKPLRLRGSGFAGHERIRLTAAVGSRTARRVVVTASSGAFSVTFRALVYDRCHGTLKVSALPSRSRKVSFVLRPLPCPAAGTDSANR
jgi:hypothetical protein